MRRVFWVRGQRRFYGICWLAFLVIVVPILNLTEIVSQEFTLRDFVIFDTICFGLVVAVTLEIFVQRLVVEDWGITAYDMLNRAKPPLSFDRISAYTRTVGGDWVVSDGDQIYRIPRIDKQQFHAVIAECAPKALNAKLWNCGQLPPAQEFTGLSIFDFNLWLNSLVGALVISLVFGFFATFFAAFYFLSSLIQVSYDLKNVVGRMSITSEGIAVSWPWTEAAIAWNEITAVFCERNAGRWTYFVVTAPGRSIIVPSHVLIDPEVRRKFFYNIPDQTKCVNFDKMRFRGRGRGKKIYAGDEATGYSLDPQLTG